MALLLSWRVLRPDRSVALIRVKLTCAARFRMPYARVRPAWKLRKLFRVTILPRMLLMRSPAIGPLTQKISIIRRVSPLACTYLWSRRVTLRRLLVRKSSSSPRTGTALTIWTWPAYVLAVALTLLVLRTCLPTMNVRIRMVTR